MYNRSLFVFFVSLFVFGTLSFFHKMYGAFDPHLPSTALATGPHHRWQRKWQAFGISRGSVLVTMPANQIIWNHFIFRFAKEQRPCHASYGNLITGLESDFEIIRIKRFLRSVVTLLCLSFFSAAYCSIYPFENKTRRKFYSLLK